MRGSGAFAPTGLVCLRRDGPRQWADLLADAARLRPAIAGSDAICNLAAGRYDFAVLLLAAVAEGVPTILPTSRAEEAVAAALDGFRAPLVVTGPEQIGAAGDGEPIGNLAGELTGEVRVYTSGSTGVPVCHVKTWTALAGGGALAARLGERAGLASGRALIVGTTPHQHMFGLEAVIFNCLAHCNCMADETPFYPADLEAAVGRAEAHGFDRIVLVSSPPHLRFLEEAVRALPQIRCVISATAPLHRDLAARLETDGRRVFEIYGSTETGSVAWRRTAETDLWTPIDGLALIRRGDRWEAGCPHLGGAVELPDELALEPDGRFRLLGRHGDMLRIAGKRQSLGAINAALSALAGVGDAVAIREPTDGEDRLCVLVVPLPGGASDEATLSRLVREHLLRHIDPVFVPRRVRVVAELPRNATGKIVASDLAGLAGGAAATPLSAPDRFGGE